MYEKKCDNLRFLDDIVIIISLNSCRNGTIKPLNEEINKVRFQINATKPKTTTISNITPKLKEKVLPTPKFKIEIKSFYGNPNFL